MSFLEQLKSEGEVLLSLVTDNLLLSQAQIEQWISSFNEYQTGLVLIAAAFILCLFLFALYKAKKSYKKIKVNDVKSCKWFGFWSSVTLFAIILMSMDWIFYKSIVQDFKIDVQRAEVKNTTKTIPLQNSYDGLLLGLSEEADFIETKLKEKFTLLPIVDNHRAEINLMSQGENVSAISLAWRFCKHIAPLSQYNQISMLPMQDLTTCLIDELAFEEQVIHLLNDIPKSQWKLLNQSNQESELAIFLDLHNFILNRLSNNKKESILFLYNQAINLLKIKKEVELPVLLQQSYSPNDNLDEVYQQFKSAQEKLSLIGQDQRDFIFNNLPSILTKKVYEISSSNFILIVSIGVMCFLMFFFIDFLLSRKINKLCEKALNENPDFYIHKDFKNMQKNQLLFNGVLFIFFVVFSLSLLIMPYLKDMRELPTKGNEKLTNIILTTSDPVHAYGYFATIEKAIGIDFVKKQVEEKIEDEKLSLSLFRKMLEQCYFDTLVATEKEQKVLNITKNNQCIEEKLSFYKEVETYVKENQSALSMFAKKEGYGSILALLEKQNLIGLNEVKSKEEGLKLLKLKVAQMAN